VELEILASSWAKLVSEFLTGRLATNRLFLNFCFSGHQFQQSLFLASRGRLLRRTEREGPSAWLLPYEPDAKAPF